MGNQSPMHWTRDANAAQGTTYSIEPGSSATIRTFHVAVCAADLRVERPRQRNQVAFRRSKSLPEMRCVPPWPCPRLMPLLIHSSRPPPPSLQRLLRAAHDSVARPPHHARHHAGPVAPLVSSSSHPVSCTEPDPSGATCSVVPLPCGWKTPTRQMYVPRGMRCQRMRAVQSDSRSRSRLRKRYGAASTASWSIGVSGAARFTAAQYARPLGRCSMSGNPPRCRYISEAVQPMRAPSAGTHNSTSTMSRFARNVTLVVEDGASFPQGSPDRATTRYRPARRR